ncbi:MAG: hypothetical protein FJ100_22505 [Deltaproteobacteria bacterium]|nr:hypothetical protein [Deltaproteobacteria bacterium]
MTNKVAARAILVHLGIDGDEEIRAGTVIAIRGPPGAELYPAGMFDAGDQDAVDGPAPDDLPEVRRDELELAASRAAADANRPEAAGRNGAMGRRNSRQAGKVCARGGNCLVRWD